MRGVLLRQIEQMQEEVLQFLSKEQLLSTPEEDLVEYLVEKYTLDLPSLVMEGAVRDVFEANVPVHHPLTVNARLGGNFVIGTIYNLEIPYVGHKSFFRVRPSRYPVEFPLAYEESSKLVITIYGANLEASRITAWFNKQVDLVQTFLTRLFEEREEFAPALFAAAKKAVDERVKKLRRDIDVSAAIPFPLKERSDAPRTYAAQAVRRKATLPSLPQSAPETHPTLAEEHYRHILSIIEQMTNVMERSPKAFRAMQEEDIRFHYLVQLNGHYEGMATGETFNYEGKTDIFIRDGANVLFIAECKIWDGPKALIDAIDQILGNVTWRDTKTAIIVLSRNKDFTRVITEALAAMQKHPNHKSGPTKEGETRYRYQFANRDDEDREFELTLLLFDIPKREHDR